MGKKIRLFEWPIYASALLLFLLIAFEMIMSKSSFISVFQMLLTNHLFLALLMMPVLLFSYRFWWRKKVDRIMAVNNAQIKEEKSLTQAIANYSERLISGDFDVVMPESSEDEITDFLKLLKSNLLESKKKEEDDKWISEGLSLFIDLLRIDDQKDLQVIYDNTISTLVKYTSSSHGALFVASGDEKGAYAEMVSCYAYDRKKYLDSRIRIGDGLVGQVLAEKERVILKEIPENYTKIGSGLGNAPPRVIVIFPLILNEEIVGIVEMATLKTYDPHHFELMDQLAESIASTLFTIKNTEKTRVLLDESKEKTLELESKEELMKQNMEELIATQEDMKDKENELKVLIQQIESNNIKQNIEQISLGIESYIKGARHELSFLKKVPPIAGMIRAIANNGIDPNENTPYEIWLKRFSVILESLIISKGLYDNVSLVNKNFEQVCAVGNMDGETISNLNIQNIDKEASKCLENGEEGITYILRPIKLEGSSFCLRMITAIFHEHVFQGGIILALNCRQLVGQLKMREDDKNTYQLLFSDEVLYANNKEMNKTDISREIVINESLGYRLTIQHFSVNY